MEILNKTNIDALIEQRNIKNREELSEYKELGKEVMNKFIEYKEKFEKILCTLDYLEENKLNKVASNIIYNTINSINNNYNGLIPSRQKRLFSINNTNNNCFIFGYKISTDETIEIVFFPKGDYCNTLLINLHYITEFNLRFDYKNNNIICNNTNTQLKYVFSNYKTYINKIMADIKPIVSILYDEIYKINNQTNFE